MFLVKKGNDVKVTLTFDTDSDQNDDFQAKLAFNAYSMFDALADVSQLLRTKAKYGDDPNATEIREAFYSILADRNLQFLDL